MFPRGNGSGGFAAGRRLSSGPVVPESSRVPPRQAIVRRRAPGRLVAGDLGRRQPRRVIGPGVEPELILVLRVYAGLLVRGISREQPFRPASDRDIDLAWRTVAGVPVHDRLAWPPARGDRV